MNPYSYNTDDAQFDLKLKKETPKWSQYSVEFASAYKTPFSKLNQAQGHLFLPHREEKVPLIILLHGVGDRSMIPCWMLARDMVSRGIASFILYQPYHSSRMTPDMNRRFPILTDEEWFDHYRISVINVRQIMDWASRHPAIDSQNMVLFGLSLGGFVSAITMGVDSRVKAGILTVMGGNSAKISQLSPRWVRRGFALSEEKYRQQQEIYHKYLGEVVQKGFAEVMPPQQLFLIDPMTFAALLRARPVCMFNALWDEAIPREAALDFWETCGKPPIMWLPATHATIWAWYPIIRRKIYRFLLSAFDTTLIAK
jgi:cephalosporin-C deacetylase-like acetyl esterase